jgi:hypothetical protein
MRFVVGPIPKSERFHPAETGWSKLKEPDASALLWLSLSAGGVAGAALVSWHLLVSPIPLLQVLKAAGPRGALVLALLLPLTMLLHELVHMVAQPGSGRSSATIVGFWPSKMVAYAVYDGDLTRLRFLAVGAAPLIALSVVPALGSLLLGGHPIILAMAALNALAACGDMMGIALIVAQVPRRAVLRNLGYDTWWKEAPIE